MSCSLPTLYNVQSQEKILDTRVKRRMWGTVLKHATNANFTP